ncbi:hypothetical protein AAFN60_20975 [Roseibacillus persicicus]|uniref:hypothetical protein n=1 Tax=Roseibacillus persicicus TaxID=454148 RepID=UPI00398B16EE
MKRLSYPLYSLLGLISFSVSCTPGNNNGPVISGPIGNAHGAVIYRQLEPQLREPAALADDMEAVALKFKTNYANQPQILTEAQRKYDTAKISLEQARQSLIEDVKTGAKGASPLTTQRFETFENDGNALRAYYSEVSNEGRFGSAILVGLGLIDKMLSSWQTYEGAKVQYVESAIEQQLAVKSWSQL